MKKALFALVVAALAVGGYYGYRRWSKPKAPPYRTAAVERGDITVAVSATGTINAVTTVSVGTQVSGTIRKLYVDYNSRVKKGQPIAQLDPSLFEAAVTQARGNVQNAKASLERARVTTADAARTLRRNQELIPDGFVAQADVDAAQTAYDQAVAQQKGAEAQVYQTEGALRVAETNLGYATIHSPVDGIVISRNVDVGQTVAASFQTPTLFSIAQDLTKMQIDTSVDEADIADVKAGLEATFTVDAYPEKTFSGKVHQVRKAPIIAQNVVTYDVVVLVDNKDLRLMPGMTANVTIPTQTVRDVLKIPNAALRFRPTGQRRTGAGRRPVGPRVYVVGPEGGPRPVPVKVGISDGSFTQLVSGNLREGEALITDEPQKRTSSSGGGFRGMRGFR